MIKKYIGHKPDLGILVLRVILGIIFFAHGYQKFAVTGIDGVALFFTNAGIPAALLMAWVVSLIELIGGLALIFGFYTRQAAFLLGIIMIVAILKIKIGSGLLGGYELDLGLFAGLAALVFGGAGKFALQKEE